MTEQQEETQVVVAPPKKLSGAQRKKDERERVRDEKTGVLKLGIWQPHAKVLRGRQNA